jgi:hypothetical protein
MSFHYCFKNCIGWHPARAVPDVHPRRADKTMTATPRRLSHPSSAQRESYIGDSLHSTVMAPPNRGPVFGQAMQKRKVGASNNRSNYQRQFGGGGSSSTSYRQPPKSSAAEDAATTKADYRRRKQAQGEVVDESFGVEKFSYQNVKSTEPEDLRRRGWLYNVLATTVSNRHCSN